MKIQHTEFHIETNGQGTYEISDKIRSVLKSSGLENGTLNVFCRHTSCSLVLMENADPSARHDLENYLNRLVPDNNPHFTHTYEGPDDMPSHIKTALTQSSESIPFTKGNLLLGTWQGLFLWEHRIQTHTRHLVVSIVGE